MKYLNLSTGIQPFLTSITRSIFSSTKHPKARTFSNRVSRFRGPLVRIALAVLLVGLTLSASMFERGRSTAAFSESIATFDSACSASKAVWDLNQTACAKATGTTGERRIVWVAPDGRIADVSTPFSGNGSDTYTFLTSGDFAQYGTWTVKTVDNSGAGFALASFLVRNAGVDNVDLVVSKFGPDTAIAGGVVSYRIEILNRGPNVAQSVVLTESSPNNCTFASEVQDSGPSGVICGNPDVGFTGASTCTIPSLAANGTAVFTFVYNVNGGTPVGTLIVNTASVASSTNELFQNDNTGRYQVQVAPGTASPGCTITCPDPITVPNDDPNPCVKAVTYTTPTAPVGCADPDTGQIPPVVCSPPSTSNFPIGTSSVVCSTGTTTCSFTITVNETRAPVTPTIACPSNVTANESSPGSGSARVNYPAPTTTGNCVSVVCNPQSGDLFALGTTLVTCNATDSANTTVSCPFPFSVTVNVSTCGLACPDDKTVNESSPGSGSATVTYTPPTTAGCPIVTIVCNPASASSFLVGITQVNCTATDQSSSIVATCSFTVRVNSSSTCAITCPPNIPIQGDPEIIATETCPNGNPPPNDTSPCKTVIYDEPSSTEGCLRSCNPHSGSKFGVGITTVHCSATDLAGNTSSCSFTVTITGGTPCVITCPSTFVIGAGSECGNTVTYSNPTTTGSCGGDPSEPPFPPIPTCNPPSGSFFPVGIITVICTTDVGTQCSFPVTISGTDTVAPVISFCAAPTFALADSNSQGVVPNVTSDVEATDNCTPTNLLTITQNPLPGTIVGPGTITITVTVKDANNNSSTCATTFKVCLFESIPPTAVCKDITVALNASGNASITGTDVDNGSSDNCGIASRTVSPSTFTCANKGPNTVTLTVTDPSSNSATCTATVTVVDNTPPTALCKDITVNLSATSPGTVTVNAADINNGSTDNCGVTQLLIDGAASKIFGCGNKGANTVTLTVKDASNNAATCTATVTVVDNTPPTALCKDITVNLSATSPGTVTVNAADINNGSTDNCGVTQLLIDGAASKTFGCANKGANTVTLTVKDASNNAATCTATVTVVDNTPPTIACLSDIIVDFDPGVNGAIVTYATPVGTDNCPGATTTQIGGLPSGATFPAGTTTNTFKVTDAGGVLTAQCSFKVTVALTSLIGLDSVSITGSGLVDSYDSTGGYPATKGSLANVLSNGTITLGNSGKVFGNVRSTQAGVVMSGASQVTGNATAGTTVSRTGSAIVGGTITNGQLAPFMTLPSVSACVPYSPSGGITGTYSYNSSTGDLSLSGVNIATLANGAYCFHNVTLTNSAQLKVNGPVVIKITGTLNASGATSLTNTTAIPGNLRILSSFSGSNGVTLSNGANAYLVIYAPNTGVTITGAAPLFGTVAGKTLTISNSGMIHYDIRLKSIWPDIWSLIP
jgi:hypothetical protein